MLIFCIRQYIYRVYRPLERWEKRLILTRDIVRDPAYFMVVTLSVGYTDTSLNVKL